MHNFIPNNQADNAVDELTTVIKLSPPNEVDLAKAIVDAGFGNIAQFAKEATERILAHKHKFLDPDEECPFATTEEVDVFYVRHELEKLVKEYTERNLK